jgi:hypothetical protein
LVDEYQAEVYNKTDKKLGKKNEEPVTSVMKAGQKELKSIDKMDGNSPVLEAAQKLNFNPQTIKDAQAKGDTTQEMMVQTVNDLSSTSTATDTLTSRTDDELDDIDL